MEETALYTILSTFLLALAIKLLIQTTRKQHKNLPPSPPALPIIGHLHLLKQPINRTLQNLSQKYGPVISLRFGTRLAIVVSSPSAVEECFTKNDVILADRPQFFIMGKYSNYNNTTLATSNYNDQWRNLRKISTVEIFSSSRLSKFSSFRKDEVVVFLRRLHQVSCNGFGKVQLRPMFMDLMMNVILRMVAGKSVEEGTHIRELVEEFMGYTEMTYIGDLLPCLQWLEYKFIKKMIKFCEKFDSFLQGLIDENRMDKDRNSMINHLLALQDSQPDNFSDENIKGLILVLLLAGTETLASSVEWATANLLNNPLVLKKAKAELDAEIGEDRLIDESDLPKLNYFQSILCENLRLYPVTPLLLPHMASDSCTIGGYHIPANAMVLVNVWSIQRDPSIWEDPTCFKPERFEDGGRSSKFQYFPFGLGRRSCPAVNLVNKSMGLTLGALIQCFEWERIGGKEIDMSEKVTSTMSLVKPLEAMCKSRPILPKLLF